ncbi:MAG: hypothetical protein JXX29_11425 [Deltaproteobacteria bacterium]|nr:hypothetical protein [Deltaproteobacteria bacterium]MBN2672282.1 hypothetical protein [Deltaproteobacteria bacterium]
MPRYTLALTFALVTLFGAAKTVSAQEILLEGPLAGAPAVKKKVQYRKLRFSVGPQFGYTLLNDYMHNFMLGAKAEFNVTDWLGIGVVGFYTLNAPTHLTNHISSSDNKVGADSVPSESNWPSYTGSHNFEEQVSRLKSLLIGQIALVPFRGKMAAFEKLFVAIDGYIFLGGGVVVFQERTHCNSDNNGCGELSLYQSGRGSVTRDTFVKPTVSFGLGFTAYFNHWIGLNIEYRLAPFKWNAAGTDEAGQPGNQWIVVNDNDETIWDEYSPSGEGDYPDGKIDDADRTWNANQSVIIGVVFNLPRTPKITD